MIVHSVSYFRKMNINGMMFHLMGQIETEGVVLSEPGNKKSPPITLTGRTYRTVGATTITVRSLI